MYSCFTNFNLFDSLIIDENPPRKMTRAGGGREEMYLSWYIIDIITIDVYTWTFWAFVTTNWCIYYTLFVLNPRLIVSTL